MNKDGLRKWQREGRTASRGQKMMEKLTGKGTQMVRRSGTDG